jgi:hypothetical protein
MKCELRWDLPPKVWVVAVVVVARMKSVGVFYTDKNRVVKITHSSFELVLQTTKHTMIYPSLGPFLEVIALCTVV